MDARNTIFDNSQIYARSTSGNVTHCSIQPDKCVQSGSGVEQIMAREEHLTLSAGSCTLGNRKHAIPCPLVDTIWDHRPWQSVTRKINRQHVTESNCGRIMALPRIKCIECSENADHVGRHTTIDVRDNRF
ncbi:hypothetical protein CEXT_504981 [Caerostris extrusa]|uniref:Uncharacterized protein n=1 Tax=Caerostris extrusa TaxID=172846 RepID=A0AAV4PL66_CAEEX|nr:hypothetical protein CEXT_504981 [Caerostris extrusa]